MSRGYSATPLCGLSRNSAVAGIFSWKSLGHIKCALVPCVEQSFTNLARENRRDSHNVTSPASWVYTSCRELKTLKRKWPGCWMLFGRERKFTENRLCSISWFFMQRHKKHDNWLNIYVSRDRLSDRTKIIISRSAFGSQPSAVIPRVLNKNAVSWQTRNNRTLPKHKFSQNAKSLQCLLKFGLIKDNVTVFQWPWNSESR